MRQRHSLSNDAAPTNTTRWLTLTTLLLGVVVFPIPTLADSGIRVSPSEVELRGPESSQQLLVLAGQAPKWVDRTREVEYESADPAIAIATKTGRVLPRGNGETSIRIRGKDREAAITVRVTH